MKMSWKELQNKIKEIDDQLAELEKEEAKQVKHESRALVDQTEKALETIKEVVEELKEIDDLEKYRNEEKETYENSLLTIVSWFRYLKSKKSETKEYEEACSLLMSLAKKHPILTNWCQKLVENPIKEYEPRIHMNIALNLNESNEYQVNNELKVVFNATQVKDYCEKTKEGKDLNNRVLDYQIVYKENSYNCRYAYESYRPKWEYDEACPFRATVFNVKTDKDENPIVEFTLMTLNPIEVLED